MSDTDMSKITPRDILCELEEQGRRIKALEDAYQRIATAIIAAPNPTPKPTENQTQRTTDSILNEFPDDMASRLKAEIKGDYWIIKPTNFLGSNLFADIANEVRRLNGEYISAGKDSHFRVPK
jgi:hypothetical protein